MKTAARAAVLVFLLPVPHPHGWIGTTSEWMRGLGIVFVILNLVLLAFA